MRAIHYVMMKTKTIDCRRLSPLPIKHTGRLVNETLHTHRFKVLGGGAATALAPLVAQLV